MTRGASLLERYTTARAALGVRLAEPPVSLSRTPSELALQASFYAGEFGLAWTALDGEHIEIVHLGEWNREQGPDFVGARLRIDGRDLQGDVELDREDLDWERHGHSTNPAFDNVRIHVFFRAGRRRYHTRTSRHSSIPQVLISAQTAHPRNVAPPPSIPPDESAARAAIEAAARFRLARKRERWLKATALHGLPEALFQALASGLGYKHNKIPFLLLAQRCTLTRTSQPQGEALLFGVAGFLDPHDFDSGTPAMRQYARGLWDTWWTLRDRESRLRLPPDAWAFAGLRPSNHPHRRLAALAAIASHFAPLELALTKPDPVAFHAALASITHPFWNHHSSLGGKPLSKPCALIGSQRRADLAANILAPALPMDDGIQLLANLPSGSPIGRVTRAATWLGIPPKTRWIHTALAQQGLLQAFEDFHPTPAAQVLSSVAHSDL